MAKTEKFKHEEMGGPELPPGMGLKSRMSMMANPPQRRRGEEPRYRQQQVQEGQQGWGGGMGASYQQPQGHEEETF